MKQISQSLTSDGFLNSGLSFAAIGADAASTARKPCTKGRAKATSPIRLMLEMDRSNRLETPAWILLAISACVALGLSL